MTIADSRVVGWQWEHFVNNGFGDGYWIDQSGHEYPEILDQSDLKNPNKYRNMTALVPLSLLAEAETERDRLTSCLSQANILIEQFERDWYMSCDERDRNAAQRDALQSRLDAVVGLADEMQALLGSKNIQVPAWHRLRGFAEEIRSAALGGESPGNDEVVR